MIFKLPGLSRRANAAVIDRIYGDIVAAARQPAFYADMQVPDTPLGRFEMISVHLFLLFMRARRSEKGVLDDLVQEITDEFFKDVDHSLRELGIGDMGVPKRMKKLARMFYGRCNSYGDALEAGDGDALASALARNIHPDRAPDETWQGASALAAYMSEADADLAAQAETALLEGHIVFADASAFGGSRRRDGGDV